MSESFEAGLISSGSKETFKKAKKILHSGLLLCCVENTPGVLRAVCRDDSGRVFRSELQGFPRGPFSGRCSCGESFCCHAMASALYHAKYTIKYKEPEVLKDTPAQYFALKSATMPDLLALSMRPFPAHVEIDAECEFPHVPSRWEFLSLSVRLISPNREYLGSLNNLRQLYFEKKLAVTLSLTDFPLQDRQIIRYLSIHGDQGEGMLTLKSEECAEFFHCLSGFPRFKMLRENVIVHKETAVPLLLLEKMSTGYLLRSAIAVNGSPLPLNDVKLITGANGCWVGMLGEYWWVPALADVNWLRNFLRTTVQPCDGKTARALLDAKESLPVLVVPSDGVRVRMKKFKTVYDGTLDASGSLHLKVSFDYGGQICKADGARLEAVSGDVFLRRNSEAECEVLRELVNFGFRKSEGTRKDGAPRFLLKDREAVGMFADEVIPKWIREKRACLISSDLAALCGGFASAELRCRVLETENDAFKLEFAFRSGGVPIRWKTLVHAAKNNEYYLPANSTDSIFRIPLGIRALTDAFADIAELLPKDDSLADSDILRIPRIAAPLWAARGASFPGAVPVDFLRIKTDFDRLREEVDSCADLPAPELFHGELRGYQAAGVRWISGMFRRNCNLILADEMGLGKTIQTLAALVMNPELTLPAMVICPTSLVQNWRRETERFTPSLRIEVIAGPDRAELWNRSADADLLICSYSILKRDLSLSAGRSFRTLVLDEAQHIKNPSSANAMICKQISAVHKLVLTGTPVENSAEDLWSVFDFLHSGFLGPLSVFRAKYARNSTPELRTELAERIAPYLLRRKKTDVCLELPEKLEQTLFCEMSAPQRELYDRLAAAASEQFRFLCAEGASSSGIDLLAALMRLRQTCCDPALLPADLLPSDGTVPPSAKMELLREVLSETLDSGHKILVFSQFTSMLKRIRLWLDEQSIRYEYLDGSTTDRMERVDSFNSNAEIHVFLLSLKAGGAGLNLTAADTVVLCDPWWNPAAEEQAEDRSHRIGQTHTVHCMRLAVKDSIEERVLALQEKKKELFRNIVEDAAMPASSLSMEDFEFLLS